MNRLFVGRVLSLGLLVVLGVLALAACGGDGGEGGEAAGAEGKLARVVEIEGGRGLYVRCTGSGSPTVVMEAGDETDSSHYIYVDGAVAQKTRTCTYDRAGLGRSDPAPAPPRELPDLVGDLEKLLDAAEIPGPYVLVGASGGGYIITGYAVAHPDRVAGMVFVDTPAPWSVVDSPRESECAISTSDRCRKRSLTNCKERRSRGSGFFCILVNYTDPYRPGNIEHRDFLQVEKDVWEARRRIGNIPVRIISADYPDYFIKETPYPEQRKDMRHNVEGQEGWLVLSPQAKQIVVDTGHNVLYEDPEVVIEEIAGVLREARAKPS
jgi:pimeloyl-ACP methyl ester carboxylesterase